MIHNTKLQNNSTSMALLDDEAKLLLDTYIGTVEKDIAHLPADIVRDIVASLKAKIELDIELERAGNDIDTVKAALNRLGEPHRYASQIRTQYKSMLIENDPGQIVDTASLVDTSMQPCRVCSKLISRLAFICPNCGAPTKGLNRGYEWKSKATICGYPLVHVAFGKDENGKIRVAKGVVAIGQFGIGAFTIAQFGIGFIAGLGQFMLAPIAVGQFAAGLVAIGQFAMGIFSSLGMITPLHPLHIHRR